MIKLRWYQQESIDAIFNSVNDNPFINPLCVVPTGAGKTFIICGFINKWISHNPSSNILVLSHVAEILEQNKTALENYFDGIEIGLYSAGLNSRSIKKITVAGIQSVYNKPECFNQFDIVIIDEAHLIPMNNNTMYRSFLGKIDSVYIGLTATHFRLGHGYIHKGKNALFDKIVYDLSSSKMMRRLIDDGYLSPLITKNTYQRLNPDEIKQKIRTTAGDYNLKDVGLAFDRESITNKAVDEIIKFGKIFKLWLIFAIDIKHAQHIADKLTEKGVWTVCLHSKIKNNERKEIVNDIKTGVYRAVVNVNILTTGFDAPQVDLIAVLRPTKSPVFHVQSLGRGLRVAPGKKHCLVLDFAGNIDRLGPVDDVLVKQKGEKTENGEPIVKECPKCLTHNYGAAKRCINCGFEFIFIEKIETKASNEEPLKKEMSKWVSVDSVAYSVHQKKGAPNSMRVTYQCGITQFSEWVCFDHKNYAGYHAENWVKFRWDGDEIPKGVTELIRKSAHIRQPQQILVNNSGKYISIQDYRFCSTTSLF